MVQERAFLIQPELAELQKGDKKFISGLNQPNGLEHD